MNSQVRINVINNKIRLLFLWEVKFIQFQTFQQNLQTKTLLQSLKE